MKKLILCVSILLTSVLFLWAYPQTEPVQFSDTAPLKAFQFPFNGAWMPDENPLHVGAGNYTTVQNLRPKANGYETVEGYSKINTTLTDTPVNIYQFAKKSESHVITKVNDSGAYYLYDNTTAVPGAGDFEATALKTVASGYGSFSSGPKGTMLYADSQNALIWGGDEIDIAGAFISEESDATDLSNVTNKITNDYLLQGFIWGSGGNDANTVFLLQADDQADESTTITDSSATPHTVTANGDAQIDTTYKKFSVGSILFDGTGDYLSIPDHADFIRPFPDFWFKINSISSGTTQGIYNQYDDASNYIAINIVDSGSGTQKIDYVIKDSSGTPYDVTLSTDYHVLADGQWHHVAYGAFYTATYLYLDGVREDIELEGVAAENYSGSVEIGRSYNGAGYDYFNGAIDEFRISSINRWPELGFTPPTFAYADTDYSYLYIASPLKLDGIKIYLNGENTVASTITAALWNGSAFSSFNVTDNTSDSGVALAQSGTITFDYNNDANLKYFDGMVLYLYRFYLSAGGADVYKITASAPLQPIRDVWNGSPRTCTSFQLKGSGKYEDYTFPVTDKDSTTDSPYGADIGGSDTFALLMFDDRSMGVQLTMVSSLVNAATSEITSISYWDGAQYVAVDYFEDYTLDDSADSSFSQSGAIIWNPPSADAEQPIERFGIRGYLYKIDWDNALTANTTIDQVTGITAPLDIEGYTKVGTYNGRVMLIKGDEVYFSQSGAPWVFNGVDSSDGGRYLLKDFTGGGDIVATANLFNRYGSSRIESWIVLKSNSIFTLDGSQPYQEIPDPFIIRKVSDTIGCAAPLSVVSAEMEIEDGLEMNIIAWLDFSGPVAFDGTVPRKIPGVENYFDPSESECINYSYIDLSFAYMDTVNSQLNILFPSGSGATAVNKWIVYDFKNKKWFEKVPSVYPTCATAVIDTNGARYNYGFISTGQMYRLDNGQTWDGTAISQNITTGYFSPPVMDDLGFWTRSEIRALRVISADITEDRDLTATIYRDGVSSDSVVVALNASGVVSKNSVNGGNIADEADFFSAKFTATTSSNKWNPLAWGYKARVVRED
jgi:hypothetical protein